MIEKHRLMSIAGLTLAALTYARNRSGQHTIKAARKRHAMNKVARASRKRNRR